MKKLIFFLLCIIACITISCSPKTNHCNHPEINTALKEALKLNMKDWQKNAKYAGIDNFEKEVDKIIKEIEIILTTYEGAGNESSLDENINGPSTCRCNSIIRFKNHEKYKQRIKGPVTKVRAEEHRLNSAYMRLESQMNYLDNDGFMFSYVVLKNKENSIQVLQNYPLVLEANIDHVGGLIFDYIERDKVANNVYSK